MDDLVALAHAVGASPGYDPAAPLLVDATGLIATHLTTRSVVTRAASPRPPARVAIAASRDAVYGLARMFQTLSEGRGGEVAVFRTLDEADAWLRDGHGPR